MKLRLLGTAFSAVGTYLWFMPFVDLGNGEYQAGNHIGGVAYLLLATLASSAVLAWTRQYIPMIIAISLSCVVCIQFLIAAGSAVAWGLLAVTAVSLLALATSVIATIADHRQSHPGY